jgi:hypothetical protein
MVLHDRLATVKFITELWQRRKKIAQSIIRYLKKVTKNINTRSEVHWTIIDTYIIFIGT